MAIAVEAAFNGHGATLENYKKAVQKMGATPGGPHPDPGCLFHWVTQTGGGLLVTDVWKSKQQFETFAAEKIGPIGDEVGLPRPHIKFVEVASFNTAG